MTSTCATRALAHHSRLIRLRMGMLAQGLRTFQPPAARFDLFLKKRTSPPTIKKTTPMRSTRVRCGRGGRYGGTVFSGTTSTTRPLTTSTTRPLTTRSNPNVASINPTQHPTSNPANRPGPQTMPKCRFNQSNAPSTPLKPPINHSTAPGPICTN